MVGLYCDAKFAFCDSFQRPIGSLGEFNPGWLCIRSGPITVELRTGRRGYVPGDAIPFYVEIENSSGWKLLNSSLSLVQVRFCSILYHPVGIFTTNYPNY